MELSEYVGMDKYLSFSELAKNEKEGKDFSIVYRQADRNIAVVAIHGGGIEPGTADIADAVAGMQYTYYALKGLKRKNNKILHLSSNRYDEPQGVQVSQNARVVLSIHGCREKNEIIFVGGKDLALRGRFISSLRSAGFVAVVSEVPGQRGINEKNICNRCKSGKGVQLEISRGLRDKMYEDLQRRSVRKRTPLFYSFVGCLKTALEKSELIADGEILISDG